MKKLFLILLSMVLIISFVQAQTKIEVTTEISVKTGGEFTVTGNTFDEVWDALPKALMLLKFRVGNIEKDSKILIAQKRVSAIGNAMMKNSAGGGGVKGDETPNWNLTLSENEDGIVNVFCVYDSGRGRAPLRGTKPFKELIEKLQEVLENRRF